MIAGRLTIVEPWVPEDQISHDVTIIGRLLHDADALMLVAERPIGWGDWGVGQLVVARPRVPSRSLFGATNLVISGSVWGGRGRDPLRFLADLELEEAVDRKAD